ncbi:MAG TPA: hypothetical protein VK532_00605 [Gaiellaceae bacterium]|jgi:hypothetical protein|nr:hypothetical protein [Gaiellaceae bacterium]
MGSKRQQTFAKMERERRVKEKRALKQEKKQNAAAERLAGEAEPVLDGDLPEGQDDQVEGQEQEQQLGP